MTVPGDHRRYAYTLDQITDLIHGTFGPETFTLTVDDLIDVWKTYFRPASTKNQKGESRMHQTDLSGEMNTLAGGSGWYYQSGNGRHHGAPNEYPGGIHSAAPPNGHATAHNGRSSHHGDYGAYNSGARSSREGPQAAYRTPRRSSRRTTGPLPSLRSLDIWTWGWYYDPYRAMWRPRNSSREQEPTRAAAGYGTSRLADPLNASAANDDGLIHPQPRRYVMRRFNSYPR